MKVTIKRSQFNSIIETVVSKVLKEGTGIGVPGFFTYGGGSSKLPPRVPSSTVKSDKFKQFLIDNGYELTDDEEIAGTFDVEVPEKIARYVHRYYGCHKLIDNFNGKPVYFDCENVEHRD